MDRGAFEALVAERFDHVHLEGRRWRVLTGSLDLVEDLEGIVAVDEDDLENLEEDPGYFAQIAIEQMRSTFRSRSLLSFIWDRSGIGWSAGLEVFPLGDLGGLACWFGGGEESADEAIALVQPRRSRAAWNAFVSDLLGNHGPDMLGGPPDTIINGQPALVSDETVKSAMAECLDWMDSAWGGIWSQLRERLIADMRQDSPWARRTFASEGLESDVRALVEWRDGGGDPDAALRILLERYFESAYR